MPVRRRLRALASIWRLYDQWSRKDRDWACREHCATCCTANVTLTTLEGFWMVTAMDPATMEMVRHALARAAVTKPFRPLITTNGIAEKCIAGEPWPEDAADVAVSPCPLLAQDTCPIYDLRPFGCRCLFSTKACEINGHAEMDPGVLTLNHVVLQVIEHLDQKGYSGNLIDVLGFMLQETNRHAYARGTLTAPPPQLIGNRPLKMLMVPPEHRRAIEPFVRAIEPLLAGAQQPRPVS